jgi:hypothetical protein
VRSPADQPGEQGVPNRRVRRELRDHHNERTVPPGCEVVGRVDHYLQQFPFGGGSSGIGNPHLRRQHQLSWLFEVDVFGSETETDQPTE